MNPFRHALLTGLLAVVLATVSALPAAASTWEIDTTHSQVTFQVRHFVTQVGGEFNDFGGTVRLDESNLADSSVEFWIDASSIDTRNDNRDEHLRSEDFFHVEEHPQITFESESIEKTGENRFDVTGTLTMRGVAQRITLPVTFLGTLETPRGAKAGFATDTEIDRKEYGIVWNRALDQGGAVLGDEVSVDIDLELDRIEPEATPSS